VKAGWIEKSLGEICSIARGGSPRPIQAFLTSESDGINWVKISDATASGKYIYETAEKIKPSGAARSRIVKDGDFLLSNSMSFGRPYIMRTTGCVHDGWLVLSEYQESFNQDFLYHLLGSPQVFSQFDRLAAGSTVRNLNIELASKVIVPIPTLEEQRRIVTLFDEAFADIATAKANAEKNLQNARELFESHLDAIVTNAQANGELVPLSELATDITDGDHMPPPKVEQGLPFITIGNIDKQTRVIDFSDTFQVAREYFDGLKANKKPMRGDVLYTVTGSFGIPVLVEEDKEFCFQRHIGLIRPKADVDSTWLHYLLQSPQVFNQAADGATGTAQKTVSLKVLRNFQVPKTSTKEQLAHVETLKSVERECRRLESIYRQKLTALEDLKKSLLHHAFTGQL